MSMKDADHWKEQVGPRMGADEITRKLAALQQEGARGMMNSTAEQFAADEPEPEYEIPRELRRLHDEMAALKGVLDELDDRLVPVVSREKLERATKELASCGETTPDTVTRIGAYISDSATWIQDARKKVAVLIGALEV